MRGRDVRAISFCVATTVVLAGIVYVLSRSVIITAALVGAWLAFAHLDLLLAREIDASNTCHSYP